MTVLEASKLLGVSAQFLRVALQEGKYDFGVAVKLSPDRWTYSICSHKLYAYLGVESGKKA